MESLKSIIQFWVSDFFKVHYCNHPVVTKIIKFGICIILFYGPWCAKPDYACYPRVVWKCSKEHLKRKYKKNIWPLRKGVNMINVTHLISEQKYWRILNIVFVSFLLLLFKTSINKKRGCLDHIKYPYYTMLGVIRANFKSVFIDIVVFKTWYSFNGSCWVGNRLYLYHIVPS